jgi:hypothetical protein
MDRITTAAGEIDVYPVGLLADLLHLWRAATRAPAEDRRAMLDHGFRRLKGTARYLRDRARRGEWRSVKNAFNGYLAEPSWGGATSPTWRRCGHGWTKRRALRDLDRHLTRATTDG